MSDSFGMLDFFDLFGQWVRQLYIAINKAVPLYFGSVKIPLIDVLIIFIILSMIITIFWKGAQG